MSSETEKADKAGRIQARMAPFLGLLVLSAHQWLFFSRDWNDVTPVQLGLWLVLALLVFLIIMTGGFWFIPRKIRTIANDEATRDSRNKAVKGGFASAIAIALVVFVVSPFEPISAQRAAHIIISVSFGCALLVYGIEEGRHFD